MEHQIAFYTTTYYVYVDLHEQETSFKSLTIKKCYICNKVVILTYIDV